MMGARGQVKVCRLRKGMVNRMKAEEKSLKAENRIMDAALQVVKENTISGTRMHLIANKADMVQSNLHYYYKTKDDLMYGLQKRVLNRCRELKKELREHSADTLESQLDVFIRQKMIFVLEEKQYDFAEIDFWVQSRINEKIRRDFAESFADWRKDISDILDRYAADIPAEKRKYLPHIILSLLEGVTLQYLVDEECMDVEEYFAEVKALIIDKINSCRAK